jgi:hypothetical protein
MVMNTTKKETQEENGTMTDKRKMEDLISIQDGSNGLSISIQWSSPKQTTFSGTEEHGGWGDRSLRRILYTLAKEHPESEAETDALDALYARGQDWGDDLKPQGKEFARIQQEVYEMASGFMAMMQAYANHENDKRIKLFKRVIDKYENK